MSGAQFCPVCGYALRRGERQCGRCGENISDDDEDEDNNQSRRHSSLNLDFSIEAIGGSNQRSSELKDGTRNPKLIESSQIDVEVFKSYVAELERKIEALTTGGEKGALKQVEETKRRFKSRKDPDFIAAVRGHVMRMHQLQKRTDAKLITRSTYLPFLDEELISPGIAAGSVLLFSGPSGTFKSSFAAYFASQIAAKLNTFAIYLLLNERRRHFMSRAEAIGLDLDHLLVYDLQTLRSTTAGYSGTWANAILSFLEEEVRVRRADLVVIDSIGSLLSMQTSKHPRKQTFDVIERLRKLRATSVLIEEGEYSSVVKRNTGEAYIVDGVFQFLNRVRDDGSRNAVFRILKLRGSKIDPRFFSIQISAGKMRFIPSIIQ